MPYAMTLYRSASKKLEEKFQTMSEILENPVAALSQYVSFPSVSADSNFNEGVEGAREFATARLQELGFSIEIIDTPIHPVILGTRGDPSWPRLVIYGHYDVQPPDPLDLWTSEPFKATEREWRLYGRGTADNKGPQIVHMCALYRALKKNPDLPIHINLFNRRRGRNRKPKFSSFWNRIRIN